MWPLVRAEKRKSGRPLFRSKGSLEHLLHDAFKKHIISGTQSGGRHHPIMLDRDSVLDFITRYSELARAKDTVTLTPRRKRRKAKEVESGSRHSESPALLYDDARAKPAVVEHDFIVLAPTGEAVKQLGYKWCGNNVVVLNGHPTIGSAACELVRELGYKLYRVQQGNLTECL